MNILHVTAPAPVGGLERVVEGLASGHRRRGHRVALAAVLTPDGPEPAFLAAARAAGVEVHVLRIPGRGYLRERREIAALCSSFRPDVVHTHGYRSDVLDAAVARGHGAPAVTTVHGFTGGDWKNRVFERLQVRAFRRFDAVVAVSRPMVDQLVAAGVPRRVVHLVPNAWTSGATPLERAAARRALGLRPDGPVVGWAGRFSAEKAPELLVRAMPALGEPGPTVAMLGDGPRLTGARAVAARLGVGGRLVTPGLVPGAGSLLRAFDVFVLSSRTEGTPIVLFEAMAAGVPVVATRVGGVPDVVGSAEATLVPPGDPAALAAAIRAALDDPEAGRQRAAAARRRLETAFAAEPWLESYERVYGAVRRAPGP